MQSELAGFRLVWAPTGARWLPDDFGTEAVETAEYCITAEQILWTETRGLRSWTWYSVPPYRLHRWLPLGQVR